MSKKKLSYWELRKLQYEQANFQKSTEFIEWLNKEYDIALNDINSNIYRYLSNIAEDNQMSILEAKKLLNDDELKDFKLNLETFTKRSQGELSKDAEKMLNNAANRYHISRLQAMEIQIKAQIDRLLNVEQLLVFNHLGKAYKDGFYHMTYDLQTIKGYDFIEGINERKLNAILNKPWAADGKNFSERIWGRNDKLVNELHQELTQNIIRRRSPEEAIKSIAKKFETSKRNAARLVYTESASITSIADEESYKETGVGKYEIIATLDYKTSYICRDLDGKIFDLKDYKVGITAPPFHVSCRTTTVPYFDDFMEDETRAMRNPITGKTEIVKKMDYDEWHKKYIVSDKEAAKQEKIYKNRFQDKKQHKNYKKVLGEDAPAKLDDFKDLKYNNSEKWTDLKLKYRKLNAYEKMVEHEPAITTDLKEIVKNTNTKLVGLDYRLKTKESYLRKIDLNSNSSKNHEIVQNIIDDTKDVVRYTYQSKFDNLVDDYFNIEKELNKKGYELVKVKNYWMDKRNPYNGVNCNYKNKDGQIFEVQYHTKESFELKNNELHKLYEKARDKNITADELIKINEEMFKLSNELQRPLNIERIK